MSTRLGRPALSGLLFCGVLLLAALAPLMGRSAPYAAMVMDARTGEVLHSRNADTQLHPASLTKMMTLYIAFEAVERGEITLDTMVTITPAAAAEPPSKLGLRAGQQIRFRYLIRAAAVKSANDAATAIAIAISGSEAAFARRMNRTARAMGMTRTHFKNAHGLTEVGHMSTARDMTILGRHMIYDWPEYYNLFSRRSTDAGIATVNNTNRRFLAAYRGADGIKTGYTRAAGFNLVASAERDGVRIIATMFGGTSTAQRNARVAELLDMGFARAPRRAALQPPQRPPYLGNSDGGGVPGGAARTVRPSGLVTRSLRPVARPAPAEEAPLVASAEPPAAETIAAAVSPQVDTAGIEDAIAAAITEAASPAATVTSITPEARPESLALVAAKPAVPLPSEPVVVTRVSTSGGRHWGINVGRFTTKYQAERVLLRVALNEMSTLEGALRRVSSSARGHDANFVGLTREEAELACARLNARGTQCFMIAPS